MHSTTEKLNIEYFEFNRYLQIAFLLSSYTLQGAGSESQSPIFQCQISVSRRFRCVITKVYTSAENYVKHHKFETEYKQTLIKQRDFLLC